MKWSLNELRQAKETPIEFDTTLDLEAALKERRNDLISAAPVQVEGVFTVDQRGILGSFNVKTKIQVPSTRTFEPVTIPLDFDFSEYYVSHHQNDLSQFDDLDVVIVLENDVLALEDVIIDNILVQIPMQVLSEKEQHAEFSEMPQGKSWGVLTEDQLKNNAHRKDQIDPRMAKLKDFFKNDDQKNSDE